MQELSHHIKEESLMTVQKDLQKAVAAAESAKGTYASFAQSTDDQTAKQLFTQMSQDMDQHISQLNSRLSVTEQNQLNNQAE
jgi:bacterioferritin (cytochrome b1)